MTYKEEYSFEKRSSENKQILKLHPTRIPVICEKDPHSDVPNMEKRKFLIPDDVTVGQFLYIVRKRISVSPEKAIYIFIKNVLPPTAATIHSIYENYKDDDGFLYCTYSGENTFGR